MKRIGWVVVAAVIAVGCKKHEADPVAVSAVPATVATGDFKTTHTLTQAAKGSAFELADGTGDFHVTIPSEAKLTSEMMSQGGVEVWNAQAVMAGSAVDVQFGAMTVPDGPLPPDMSALDTIPAQLAAAAGGSLTKNEAGTLAGLPSRVFELTTADKRRLFGWYLLDHAKARVFQINCVGADTEPTRAACGTVATSFVLTRR